MTPKNLQWQSVFITHSGLTNGRNMKIAPKILQTGSINHWHKSAMSFDLPRHTWSLVSHFRTCRANLHKWGLAQSPSCDCGQRQTMNHIIDTCPSTKFEGRLNLLHDVDDEAGILLESTATAALAK